MSGKEIVLENIPRYADVSTRIPGNIHVKVSQILNTPLIIWKFEVHPSVYSKIDKDPNKQYMKLLVSYQSNPNHLFVAGTSSYYLISDVTSVSKYLPIRASIVRCKIKREDNTDRYAYILQ